MKAPTPEMDSETFLLLSTDESGCIPFPEGAHRKTAPLLQVFCWFVVPLFTLATPLQARLGESVARLEARYGAPVKFQNGSCTRDFQCTYHHGGMTIVVDFLDETSQCESYSNEDGSPFKPEETQALMSVNGRGGKWTLKEDKQTSKRWNLSSGDVVARQDDQNGHTFELRSSWWQNFLDQRPGKTKSEVADRLKDF